MRVCDQLATVLGRKQVADRFELSRRVEKTRTCQKFSGGATPEFLADKQEKAGMDRDGEEVGERRKGKGRERKES